MTQVLSHLCTDGDKIIDENSNVIDDGLNEEMDDELNDDNGINDEEDDYMMDDGLNVDNGLK